MIKQDDVNSAVIDFCMEVIEEPLIYFNESDLHLLLVENLYKKIDFLQEKKFITKLSYEKNSVEKYRTRLIHREYGGGNGTVIDLVIFDEDDVLNINHSHLTKDDSKDYLSPLFAFELGICIYAENHINKDIKKLSNCKDNGVGYIIHFIKNDNLEESIKKGKTLEKKFKNIIIKANHSIKEKNKIKIIAIILNIFKKDGEFYCEIFDKKDEAWYKFNRSNIKQMKKLIDYQIL